MLVLSVVDCYANGGSLCSVQYFASSTSVHDGSVFCASSLCSLRRFPALPYPSLLVCSALFVRGVRGRIELSSSCSIVYGVAVR